MTEGTNILDAIGLSQDELAKRVVDRVAEEMLETEYYDEDAGSTTRRSQFGRKLQEQIEAKIDEKVGQIAKEHIGPKVTEMVEGAVFPRTNRYGEPKQDPETFLEYLDRRANAWLTDRVNYEGKAKDETRDGFGWKASNTRVGHMVHEHLDTRIRQQLGEAFANVNSQIAKGLEEAVKIQLAEVLGNLKLTAKTKR